jgi:hypothetical protein
MVGMPVTELKAKKCDVSVPAEWNTWDRLLTMVCHPVIQVFPNFNHHLYSTHITMEKAKVPKKLMDTAPVSKPRPR